MAKNVKIKQIEEAEKSVNQLVRKEADMRREFAVDGIDAEEEKQLKQVKGKITQLKEVITTLRAEIEENKRIWEGRRPEFNAASQKVQELMAWPDPDAGDLSDTVGEIDQAVTDQRWADATSALDTLLANLDPIYEAYLLQVAAKEEYDGLCPRIDRRMLDLQASDPLTEALITQLEEFAGEMASVQEVAETNDYIAALESLRGLEPNLDVIDTAIADLAQQKRDFDAAWEALQPDLNETYACEFPDLMPMQEEIHAIADQVTAAAEVHDYDTALPLVDDLRTKIDSYMTEYAASVDQRTLYESRLPRIQAEVSEASVSEFTALEDVQGRITATFDAMTTAAADGDYETALLKMDELLPLLDEYRAAYDNALLGQEFERLYSEMEPAFADCAQSTYGPLDELAAEISGDQERAASEGAAGNYQSAIDILNAARPKIDNWHVLFGELDAAREEYDRRIADVLARFDALASCEYPQLTEKAQAMIEIRTAMESAAAEGNYLVAIVQMNLLVAMIEEVGSLRDTLDQKRAEYEANLGRVISRYDGLMQCDFAELEDERAALEQARADMEAAAAANDFILAVDLLGQVERLLDDLDAQMGNLIDLRNQYEQLYAQIKKDLAKVEGCSHVELEAKKTVITGLQTQMLDAATATDFETALAKAQELVPLLTEFLKLEELLKQYLGRLDSVKAKLDEVRAITYKSMTDDKAEIEEKYTAMAEDAAAARIEEALAKMDELQTLIAAALKLYEELKKNEPVWQKLRDDLKPQVDLVRENTIEDAEPEAKAVIEAFEKAEKLGDEEEEFIQAIAEADKINKTLLPAFRRKVDVFGDAKEAFETLSKMANEAYDAAAAKKEEYGEVLEDAFEPVEDLKGKMDEYGEGKNENYDEGKTKAKELIEACRTFDVEWKKAAERESGLQAALDTQKQRFDRLPDDADEKAEDDYEKAEDLIDKAKDAIEDKEFDDAEDYIEELSEKLDDIEDAVKTAGEHKAEYEGRRDSLKPLVRQVNESPVAEFLEEKVEAVNDAFDAMVTKGDDHEDYEGAVDLAEDVDDAISDFEKAELEVNGKKVRFDERMDGMRRSLTDAIALKSHSDSDLASRAEALPGMKDAAEELAGKGEFDDALEKAADLKTEVESILDRAEELEDEEAARRDEECEDNGPAGELGDKIDDVADKGKDLIDKAKDKVEDYVIDKALDYVGGKAKGVYHTIDHGLDAAGSAVDAADHLLDGEFGEAWDDATDAVSSGIDAAAEGVQLHPVADGIKKGVEIAKDVKDVAEEVLGDD